MERLATLDAQIEHLQAEHLQGRIVGLLSRHLETADLEQSLLLLIETRRTYLARLEQMNGSPIARRTARPRGVELSRRPS